VFETVKSDRSTHKCDREAINVNDLADFLKATEIALLFTLAKWRNAKVCNNNLKTTEYPPHSDKNIYISSICLRHYGHCYHNEPQF